MRAIRFVMAVTFVAALVFEGAAEATCVQPYQASALLHGIRNDASSWNNKAVADTVYAMVPIAVGKPTTTWQDALTSQAGQLSTEFANLGMNEGTTIGYSMGGLVGRTYLRAAYPGSRVKVHMTVGSMHQGAPILNNLQQYRLPAAIWLYVMADIALLDWGHLEPAGEGARVVQSGAPGYALAATSSLLALTEILFVRDVAGAASSNDMKPGSPLVTSLNSDQSFEADVTKVGIVAHEAYPQIYRMAASAIGVGKSSMVGYTNSLQSRCINEAALWLYALLLGQAPPSTCISGFSVWMFGYATIKHFPSFWNGRMVGSSDNDGVVPASSQVYPGGYRADVYDCNHLEEQNSPAVAHVVGSYMRNFSRRLPPPPAPVAPTGLTKLACSNGVVLGWNAVASATSYRVFKDGNLADEVTTPYYYTQDSDDRTYAVQALDCNVGSPLSTSITAGCPPPDPPPPGGVANMEWGRDWLTTTGWYPAMVVDPAGGASMTYRDQDHGLMLAWQSSPCAWNVEEIDRDVSHRVGHRSALCVGPQNTLGVVYLRELTSSTYEVCYRRGTPWASGYHWWTSPVVVGTMNAVSTPSVAIDAGGTAHVAFADAQGLEYRSLSPTLVLSPVTTVSTLPEAGRSSVSIAVDGQGAPSVAFSINTASYPYVQPSLGFARRVAGVWTPQANQVVSTSGGYGARLALDAAGQARIACMSASAHLMYVKWSNATSAWSFATATNLLVQSPMAFALDASGLARMAVWSIQANGDVPTYVRETTGQVRWESSPFDTTVITGTGSPLSLGVDPVGTVVIGYATGEGRINSIEVAHGVPGTADETPPAAVSGVTVTTGVTTAVALWMATGDDGTVGTAANYDLRYSSLPIYGETEFAQATPVPSAACPAPAGTGDCVEVGALAPCHPYYFALKVRDNAGNWSTMSNVAYGVTKCSGHEVVCESGGGAASLRPAPPEEAVVELPASLAFAVTSPNPVRGSVMLRLDVPATSAGINASVTVYDAQGRRVRSLLNERARGGSHALAWDLRDEGGARVRQGVYFVRLQIGDEAIKHSLILLD